MSTSDRSPPAPTCESCGTAASPEARFCRRCGDPLPGALPPPAPASPGDVPDPQTSEELPTATLDTAAVEAAALGSHSAERGAAYGQHVSDRTDDVGRFVRSSRSAPDERPCPVCTTPNHAGRELCVRCGVDLESGRALPAPRRGDGTSSSQASGLPPTVRRSWWIAPVAVLGVAVTILIGLWAAGIGPFSDELDLPEASFAADRYPVDEAPQPLLLTDVATVTTRPPDERTYPVEQMVDRDPRTAWHSHPPDLPEDVAEKVDLFLEDAAWVSQVVINNGDHADPDAYAAAGRIQRAELVMDGDVRTEVVLLDLGRDPQVVELEEPVLTTTVRLNVVEVVPGNGTPGVAISDLELRGWPADPTDADIAMQRADVRQAAGSFTVPG